MEGIEGEHVNLSRETVKTIGKAFTQWGEWQG